MSAAKICSKVNSTSRTQSTRNTHHRTNISNKPVVLVVISFLVIALIYGPSNTFYVFSSSQLDEVAPEAAPSPPPPPPPAGLPKIGGGIAPPIGGEAAEQPTAPGADEGTAAAPVNPGTSPTGWCMDVPGSPECIPCDPGTSGSDPEAGGGLGCVPQECWSPFGGLGGAPGACGCEELPQGGIECEYGEENVLAPTTPQFGQKATQVPLQQLETAPSPPQTGEIAPQIAPPTADEETGPPPEPLPPCPEGQELDEETDLCVPVESPTPEQPEEAAQEPEQQPAEEEQPSEEKSNN